MLGIEEKLKEIALEKYQKGELSVGEAAKFARLAVREFLKLLKERKIPMNLSVDEVLNGVKNLSS